MDNNKNLKEKTGNRLRELVKTSAFWSAIAAFAAAVTAIAAVIAIIQAKDLSERQLLVGRAQFALRSIDVEETLEKGIFIVCVQLQNVGGRSDEGLTWAFSQHGIGDISGTLDVWKNAIQDPIVSGENFFLKLEESSFGISEGAIYSPFAISYFDKSLRQEFRQYFYPKLQWSSTRGTWNVLHATANETVSKATSIGKYLNEGIERARQLL